MTDFDTLDPEAHDLESLYSVGCVCQNQDKKGYILKRSSCHVHVMRCCLTSSLFLVLDECDPSKWLAFLSEGKVGASATGEVMWLLDLSEPALTHQGTVACFNTYITCVAATGLHAFDRLLLVIWKSGRTCWASVTVLLSE